MFDIQKKRICDLLRWIGTNVHSARARTSRGLIDPIQNKDRVSKISSQH